MVGGHVKDRAICGWRRDGYGERGGLHTIACLHIFCKDQILACMPMEHIRNTNLFYTYVCVIDIYINIYASRHIRMCHRSSWKYLWGCAQLHYNPPSPSPPHTHTHTHTQTYTHARTHKQLHTHKRTPTHMHAHTTTHETHIHRHTNTQSQTQTQTQTHTPTPTPTPTHTCTHNTTQADTHTNTSTHAQFLLHTRTNTRTHYTHIHTHKHMYMYTNTHTQTYTPHTRARTCIRANTRASFLEVTKCLKKQYNSNSLDKHLYKIKYKNQKCKHARWHA